MALLKAKAAVADNRINNKKFLKKIIEKKHFIIDNTL